MSWDISIHDNLELTEEQKFRYLDSLGTCCPFCGATEGEVKGKHKSFKYGDIKLEADHWQKITCWSCKKSWYEVFSYTGIEACD